MKFYCFGTLEQRNLLRRTTHGWGLRSLKSLLKSFYLHNNFQFGNPFMFHFMKVFSNVNKTSFLLGNMIEEQRNIFLKMTVQVSESQNTSQLYNHLDSSILLKYRLFCRLSWPWERGNYVRKVELRFVFQFSWLWNSYGLKQWKALEFLNRARKRLLESFWFHLWWPQKILS